MNFSRQSGLLLVAAMVMTSVSCNRNEVIGTDTISPAYMNNPTYASGTNGFTYSITARNFSSAQTIPLAFTCDSLGYTLSVTGYVSGTVFVLLAADSVSHRSPDLAFNTSQALKFSMGCPPKSVTFMFSGFSGTMSFALGGLPAGGGSGVLKP